MRSSGFVRKVDLLGRAAIPKKLRNEKSFNIGTEVMFSIEGNQILLNIYKRSCVFCSNTENISLFKGKRICSECKGNLKRIAKSM